MASVGQIEKLYSSYKDKAHIYVIYIREAHPVGGKGFASKQFPIPDPKTIEERHRVAREFAESLKLTIPVLVDSIDDVANNSYTAWPDRIYVIDADGKIALKANPGPAGFSPAVRAAPGVLEKLLSTARK